MENLFILAILTTLGSVYNSQSESEIREAMSTLEEIARNYTDSDNTDLTGRCRWYHDVIGFTWADGSCINEEGAEDEDCPRLRTYIDAMSVNKTNHRPIICQMTNTVT